MNGIVYAITGDKKYLMQAEKSALSVRKHNPNLSITLFSNHTSNCFDQVLPITKHQKNKPFAAKMWAANKSPYENTMVLDADTLIVNHLSCWELLNRFEFCAATVPNRPNGNKHIGLQRQGLLHPEVPDDFPQVNTGVFLFKKTPSIETFFNKWLKLYSKLNNANDQAICRYLLWKLQVNFMVLPDSYNVRHHLKEREQFKDYKKYLSFLRNCKNINILHCIDCDSFRDEF